MNVGHVKIADDEDFEQLRKLTEGTDGWTLVYHKDTLFVWIKSNEVSSFNIIKTRAIYNDIKASTLYDVLHDPTYRKVWDPTILEGKEICRIDLNNDIGYFAMQLPKPLANRDFVTQRSWRDLGKEKMILNHSVNHVKAPPNKDFVRGISYLTGYHIKATNGDPKLHGCELIYVTQSDPKGNLPYWVVNKATQWLAPKVILKLHDASMGYEEWKNANNPEFRPWENPNQSFIPGMKSQDILSFNIEDFGTDETNIKEEDIKQDTLTRFS